MWGFVGMPDPDGRAYEALVLRGQATVADLAAELGMTNSRVTRILGRLAARGFATRLPGRPARFTAVSPDVAALELITAQESRLRRLREHAHELADASRVRSDSSRPDGFVELIEGAGNVGKVLGWLQRHAQNEIRVFAKPPYSGQQPHGGADQERPLREGQVRHRTIHERAALTEPGRMAGVWDGIRRGERARVTGSLPTEMVLCDSRLALIPVRASSSNAGQAACLVHPSPLLDALSALFEAVWDKAVPLNQRAAPGHEGQVLTDDDRDLLGLLTAGATDVAIARTFGWSVRTVRRHIHRIMTLTGTETRFQAGMEASRRGWV
jgi:DNA-binding CsgD family transcriptional regulator